MFAIILCVSGLFSDHMVLQRQRANEIWGVDRPQQVVALTVEGAKTAVPTVKVVTDNEGKWRLVCPELPTGGPYRLHLVGSSEHVIDDVLVGDVWLASGQSNMEFPLARAADAGKEIAAASLPQLRVAKIARAYSRTPASEATTSWETCTPATAAHFTAIGYFFARELQQELNIPIGVIDATWGGTRVEAWTSREALQPLMPGLAQELSGDKLSASEIARITADYRAKVAAWEKKSFPRDTGNEGEASGWAAPSFDDHAWKQMDVPNSVQSVGFPDNGVYWFRRTVQLPADWAKKDLTLSVGAIDDFDVTYFNGQRVGATGAETPDAYQVQRHYVVPGSLVRAGANVIAIRVFDRFGDGGLIGPAANLSVESAVTPGSPVALNGRWQWTVERTIPKVPATIYADAPAIPPQLISENQIAALYNGMIAPIIPFGLRGFIWYQGEANVATHQTYQSRFSAMIRDWRARWGEGTLPFYFVQLASFTESPYWPYLREAQAATLSEPRTGMAVAIDVGAAHDIHPTDKQTVGHRLAAIAFADSYGIRRESFGPSVETVEMRGSDAIVSFHHGEGLRTHDGSVQVRGFALAGSDHVYHPADARIEKEAVVVSCAAVARPVTVRYAWADYIEVNLENSAGFPAVPFRTDGD